jgi:hypothetical protein
LVWGVPFCLPLLVLPPVGVGEAMTGAGADEVVLGGADCVVTGGADVVAEVVAGTGLGLLAALW